MTDTENNQTGRPATPFWMGPLAITVMGVLAYANSFQGPFIFDDVLMIVRNEGIRRLWPPWRSMLAPFMVSRPLVQLSLAVNYAISGMNPWSYHVLNLLIHILAALALFGVVRRTLSSATLRDRFGRRSFALALGVSLIWMVHPLQTGSVTYVIQRCESLMGFFYFATLYCAIRSFDSRKKGLWFAAAAAACAGGILSKQIMATGPIVVLLYDFMFESGSFKAAWERRKQLYIGLAASWVLLGATLLASPLNQTAGFEVKNISSFDYLKSEFGVIVHYLRLTIWPDGLVLDYLWPKAESAGQIIPFAIPILALAAGTIWAIINRRAIGFLGAWFFIILSMTSSIMPFSDLAFEHRMYLPLAAPVALFVIGGYALGPRLFKRMSLAAAQQEQLAKSVGAALLVIVVALLATQTIRRNMQYQSDLVMWVDVVKKRPENSRGHNTLGEILALRGLIGEAAEEFRLACKYNPDYVEAHANLGSALWLIGNIEESKIELNEGVRLGPRNALAHYNLAMALSSEGKLDEGLTHLTAAVEYDPANILYYVRRGVLLEQKGRFAEAANDFVTALGQAPDSWVALSHLAVSLALQDDPSLRNTREAERLAKQAVAISKETEPAPLDALAVAYAESGRFPEAVQLEQRALELASALRYKDFITVIEARSQEYRAGRVWRPPASGQTPSTLVSR